MKKKGKQPFDTNTNQAALIEFANGVPEISLKDVHLPLTSKSTYLMESMIKSKNKEIVKHFESIVNTITIGENGFIYEEFQKKKEELR